MARNGLARRAERPASGTVNAGGFATILNGGPSFVSYCVDLYQHINFGTLYPEYTAPGTTHVFANNRAYDDLGRLYANAGVVDTSVKEAAFQIAVWEIAYETTPGAYALDSGAASFSGGSATGGALGLASTWLAGLGNGAGRSISVIESTEHQDVIFAPVPEPSTYMLMLAGLMATVEISRRKRSRPEFTAQVVGWHARPKADLRPPRVGRNRCLPHNRRRCSACPLFLRSRFDSGEKHEARLLVAALAAGVMPAFALDAGTRQHERWPSSARTGLGRRTAARVTLPDDWATSVPALPAASGTRLAGSRKAPVEDLLAHQRACSNVQVHLNGALIFIGGRMVELVTQLRPAPARDAAVGAASIGREHRRVARRRSPA
jgi:hypothetical protein